MVVFIDHGDELEHAHASGGAIDLDLNRVLKVRNAESLLRMHALHPPDPDGGHATADSSRPTTATVSGTSSIWSEEVDCNENVNLNVDHGFSAALSCYPYADDSRFR